MIQLQNISKSFGSITALQQVSFEIPQSKITILAGADGAGKSTLFKILVGLEKKSGGDILLKGKSINNDYSQMMNITGYMPERFSLYLDLSVEENMNFFADIHLVPKQIREQRKLNLLKKTGMLAFKNRRARDLSGGMKQKLALATILLSAPQFIILDEPTTGVDPLSRIEFFKIIDDLKAEGKTIAISTPYLDEAEQGDYIVFLKDGSVIKKDDLEKMKNSFPAKLFKILPKGNIFEIIKKLEPQKDISSNMYIRGKYIKFLQTGNIDFKPYIPHLTIEEEKPKLEDIYLYYERHSQLNIK